MKRKKRLPYEQIEKLFELRIKMEAYEDFLNTLQQVVNEKVVDLQAKVRNISGFVDVPLDKRIDFDFEKSTVIWEDEDATKKTK